MPQENCKSFQRILPYFKNDTLLSSSWKTQLPLELICSMFDVTMNYMCHRLTNKSTSAFLPAGVIARNSQHQKFQYAICRLYKSDKPKPSLSWMKLCSSNNHYTTMYHCNSNHSKSYWALQFFSRAHAAFFHCLMAKTNIGFYCWTCENKLD